MSTANARVVTVTLNPAIDLIYEVAGLRFGAHLPGVVRARVPAGKGINVARVLGGLGQACVAVGFIGSDERLLFHDSLSRRNVTPRFIPVAGNTRTNITLIDPAARSETHIRDVGFTVTGGDVERMAALLTDLARPDDVVCFAGSLPAGMGGADLGRLIQTASKVGARVAVDTGGDVLAAVRREDVWFAKPNRHEIAEMVGRSIDSEAELIRVGTDLHEHVSELLLSLGADGAMLFHGEEILRGHVRLDEPIVSTVGCGDALVGGYLAARVRGDAPPTALAAGIGVATASALSKLPGEFNPDKAQQFAAAVAVVSQS